MKTAVLKIYSDIGSSRPDIFMEGESEPVSAKLVSDFIDDNKDADEIVVRINSPGGDVQEGWAIHDLLVHSGKRIKTIGEGKIYSIATIIFLAGIEREIYSNADGLIHNPYIPPYTLADQYESEDLIKIAESLRAEESKILKFYAEKTGTAESRLAELMKEDSKLSAKDMLDLGFATKILEPVKAYAYYKSLINKVMDEKDVKTFGKKLDTIIEKIKGFSRLPVEQKVVDANGKEFILQKETGSPAVGDQAKPDGSFVMATGETVVIENGVVKEIIAPKDEKSELEEAKKTITELKARIAELEKSKEDVDEKEKALADREKALEEEEVKAVALATELQNLKNTWKPVSRNKITQHSDEKTGGIDLNRVKELSAKLKEE